MPRLRLLEKVLLYGIWTGFVLILLTPFVVTPHTIFPYVVGKALYSRVMIEMVFGCWALLAFLRPDCRPPRSRLLILFAMILGVTMLAAFYGVSVRRSFWSTYERMQGVVDLIHWFLFTVVLASVVRTVSNWRVLLNLNLGVSLMMALLAIGQKYYFSEVLVLTWDSFGSRVGTTFGNAIYLGMYLTVNVVIALGFLAQSFIPVATAATSPPFEMTGERRRKRNRTSPPDVKHAGPGLQIRRLFWGSVVLIEPWALVLTGSRGALAGLVTAIGFLAATSILLGSTRMARIATVGLTGLVGSVFLLTWLLFFGPSLFPPDTALSSPFSKHLVSGESFWERVAGWQAGVKGFIDKPVLGWGPENYVVIFGRHADGLSGHTHIFDNAHSKFVEELTTKGLLGLLSYLSIWTSTFWIVARAARGTDFRERIPTLFVGAALAGHFIQNQFALYSSTGSLQYSLLLAFVTNLERDAVPAGRRWARLRYTFERVVPTDLFRRNAARAVIAVGTIALVGVSLLANHSIYSSAGAIIRMDAADAANSPDQLRDALQRATDFTPLANSPRLLLFEKVTERWEVLRARSRVKAERLLALVNVEAVAALEDEPENWRIYVSLAKLYRMVSASAPEYENAARRYLEKSMELAPHRKEVLEIAPS